MSQAVRTARKFGRSLPAPDSPLYPLAYRVWLWLKMAVGQEQKFADSELLRRDMAKDVDAFIAAHMASHGV